MKKLHPVQFEKYYHGSNVPPETILKEGLKSHNPAEELNMLYGEDPDTEESGHPKGVYFGNKETAEGYGGHLYSVELPSRHGNWGWTESEGHVWEGDIPPHWVRYEGVY